MNVIIIVICLIILAGLFLLGRQFYLRSVRIANRLQMERAFINISHELLTPLTVISASLERLRMQEPKYTSDYTLMELNVERMVRLLQEILETSKLQTGELKLRVSQGDVMEYICKTALCLEPLMAKHKLHFTIQNNPKSMMGWIDTDKVDKIIYNLLSNAAKYTPADGKVTIEVNTNKTYDHIIIKVRDTGIGLTEEQKKHLFQRFYDGDYRKMQTTGTGLGLPLTRDLVFLHRGTIQCESQQGQGTTFTVSLPINKEAFSASQIDASNQIDPSKVSSTIADLSGLLPKEEIPVPKKPLETADEDIYRLLIVEDNIELLMLMQTLFSQKYFVHTATNGVEALEVIEKEEIDLIISDVMMPEMDGNELTLQIKSNPNTSHLPIILLTAKTQEEDRMQSLLIGADEYVTKPFRLGDLELRIKNIIENRKRIRREFKARTIEESRLEAEVEEKKSPDKLFLKRAIDCVYEHLSDSDFDRDAFAREMGASASTLYNKLRSITGLNVSAFIRDIRMKEAKRMAQTETDLRVSDLAYKVGFKDPKYFATCFKKEFGVQPSEYIEQMSNNN